jgi:hypothetical protein
MIELIQKGRIRSSPTADIRSQGMQAHRSPLGFSLADKPSRTVYVCAQYGQGSCGAVGRFRLPSAVTAGAAASTTDPPSARRLFSWVTTSSPAYALQVNTDKCLARLILKTLFEGVAAAKHRHWHTRGNGTEARTDRYADALQNTVQTGKKAG